MPSFPSIRGALSRRQMIKAAIAAGVAGPAVLRSGRAFAAYPDRTIKIVVANSPGGPSDIIARIMAAALQEATGASFVVENKGGAGGNIGMGAAARSAPDGTTVMVVSSSFIINPGLYTKTPYDPFKDFAPITIAGDSPHIFIVHPSVPAKSMKELIDLIKANPGKYNYASPGAGTGPHLSAELLKLTFGLDLTHVPFRGAGPAVQSVTGGHNPIGCVALPPAVQLVNGGQINGLALTSPARFPSVPNVPTMAEQGIMGQDATTMQAFLVPAKTPKEIVDLLYKELVKIVDNAPMRQRFIELGFTPVLNTPDQFAEFIKVEVAKWGKVIKDAKIEVQ